MDDKLFGTISTIIGLIVGWTLNELSYTFKSFRENKKNLKQILFIQLEIRNVIMKTNLENLEIQIKEIFLKKFPEERNNKDFEEIIRSLFRSFIQNELNEKFSKKINLLIDRYNICLDSLSQIDPFVTYNISDKDIIFDYLSYINKYLKGIEEYLDKPTVVEKIDSNKQYTFEKTFDQIKGTITPIIRESALETIELDIKVIARKISYFKYYETIKFIEKSKIMKLDNSDAKKLEFYLNSFDK